MWVRLQRLTQRTCVYCARRLIRLGTRKLETLGGAARKSLLRDILKREALSYPDRGVARHSEKER